MTSASSSKLVVTADDFGNDNLVGDTFYDCTSSAPKHFTSVTSYWNTHYTASMGSLERKSVMVHELGHALGLGHAGTSSCSGQPIMYQYESRWTSCGHSTPQSDDVA